jgi:hypothetical protein
MKLALALITFLFCAGYCYAQADSSAAIRWTALKILSVEKQHVDTILCYHSECPGCFFKKSKNACVAYNDARYLFWRKKGHNFACSIDECGDHKFATMDDSTWTVITNDLAEIIKLDPAHTFKGSARSGIDTMLVLPAPDDIPKDIFELYTNRRRILLSINDDYLNQVLAKDINIGELEKRKIDDIKDLILDFMMANYKAD